MAVNVILEYTFVLFLLLVATTEGRNDVEEFQILKRIAVIPFNEGTNDQVGLLENFALSLNSQMVYACNEYGEQVAVGIFVTENFEVGNRDARKDCEVAEKSEVNEFDANNDWVAAQEECVTDNFEKVAQENISLDKNCEVVCIYKVKKGKKKVDQKKNLRVNQLKTLKEIKSSVKVHVKKEKVVSQQNLSNAESDILPIRTEDSHHTARRRCGKREVDKTFPVPMSVRHMRIKSEFFFTGYTKIID